MLDYRKIHNVFNNRSTKNMCSLQSPPRISETIDPATNFLCLRNRKVPRNPRVSNVDGIVKQNPHPIVKNKNKNDCTYSDNLRNEKVISKIPFKYYSSTKTKEINKKIKLIKLKNTLFCLIVSIILIIIFSFIILYQQNTIVTEPTSDKLRSEIYSLANVFPNQPDDVWVNIVAGTSDYFKQPQQQPLVILLFTKNSSDNVAECIADIISTKLVRFIKNKESAKPAFLNASNLLCEDFGELFEELKSTVTSNKVLVIINLQDLAGSMALSLFALCDRYSPAVNDAVLIFTLHGKSEGHESESAEVTAILQDLWHLHVPQDKLAALVTRVTSRVVTIAPENQLSDLCTQRES